MVSKNLMEQEYSEHKVHPIPAADPMRMAVTGFVQRLGIRPNLIGYHFLIESILLALHSPEMLEALTKSLYPAVAERFGKNEKTVERNIRRAIESAYECDPERVQSVFYYKIDKPYISEVLAMAVESLRYETVPDSVS